MLTLFNRGISTPLAIGIIAVFVIAVGGGILVSQGFFVQKLGVQSPAGEAPKIPEEETPKDREIAFALAKESEAKELIIRDYLIPSIAEGYSYVTPAQIEEMAREAKFSFVKTESVLDSKEVVAFFVENPIFMQKRGIIEEKSGALSVVAFEEDPCYCFGQTVSSKKLVSGKPNFIVVEYQPNTGTCVAFKNSVVYVISGDGFREVGHIPLYDSSSGVGVTDLSMRFEDIEQDGNLEIIAEGVHKTCEACLECEGPVTEIENIKKIFRWNESSQRFIESSA